MSEATFRPRALQDVQEQFHYYANVAGVDLATRFVDAVFSTANSLLHFPRRGHVSPYPWARRQKLRMWTVDGFPKMAILYRVSQEGDVEVVRVLDERRDLYKRREP